ncbi:MAG: hypothetical protein M2R45_04710 [Verrucomicrobia subdivision 3 bacterium]|nr:hypothetical protein [Limisphaerales bacterium]MCS1416267.1 hypothetical protein [Limisphaerales bacterium]
MRVENNRLVDKDGNPVRMHKGFVGDLVTEQGEMVPLIQEEDGGLRVPTPTEIQEMRMREAEEK